MGDKHGKCKASAEAFCHFRSKGKLTQLPVSRILNINTQQHKKWEMNHSIK